MYLGHPCEGSGSGGTQSEFDVLKWWMANHSRYPILSEMAKDIFAIPMSTVPSESAFSTGGRILDDFRSSLHPKIVEALICSEDWLRSSSFLPLDDDNDGDYEDEEAFVNVYNAVMEEQVGERGGVQDSTVNKDIRGSDDISSTLKAGTRTYEGQGDGGI
ncbi:unnamed protein product [Linum trigynum]|uniref:HAT C-terminal dimerisation domain-containing protein n=1 Tax=Linum trigynum TaxID=586398 RepID=A0AAV2G8S9_9ROSI